MRKFHAKVNHVSIPIRPWCAVMNTHTICVIVVATHIFAVIISHSKANIYDQNY